MWPLPTLSSNDLYVPSGLFVYLTIHPVKFYTSLGGLLVHAFGNNLCASRYAVAVITLKLSPRSASHFYKALTCDAPQIGDSYRHNHKKKAS